MAKKKGKKGGGNFGPRFAGALKSMGVSGHAIGAGDYTKSEAKQAAAIVHSGESAVESRLKEAFRLAKEGMSRI